MRTTPKRRLDDKRNANGSGGFCSVWQKSGTEKLSMSFFVSRLRLVRFDLYTNQLVTRNTKRSVLCAKRRCYPHNSKAVVLVCEQTGAVGSVKRDLAVEEMAPTSRTMGD